MVLALRHVPEVVVASGKNGCVMESTTAETTATKIHRSACAQVSDTTPRHAVSTLYRETRSGNDGDPPGIPPGYKQMLRDSRA